MHPIHEAQSKQVDERVKLACEAIDDGQDFGAILTSDIRPGVVFKMANGVEWRVTRGWHFPQGSIFVKFDAEPVNPNKFGWPVPFGIADVAEIVRPDPESTPEPEPVKPEWTDPSIITNLWGNGSNLPVTPANPVRRPVNPLAERIRREANILLRENPVEIGTRSLMYETLRDLADMVEATGATDAETFRDRRSAMEEEDR